MIINSDEQLIADYLKGDQNSLEILIKRYLKPIFSFTFRFIRNSQEAEDITQEVFIKVWRNLKKFDQNKKFKTWIFSIAKNASIDFFRKKKTIPFSEFENENGENALVETLTDIAPLPNELFERVDIAQMLTSTIEKLLPKYRLVLFLRYNDHFTPLEVRSAVGGMASAMGGLPLTGFTFREIAETLGEPINTVKSRHRRAIFQLRKTFKISK